MGKKMKLVLDDLKVNSFVTSLNGRDEQEAKGGRTPYCTQPPECMESDQIECPTLSCGGTCDTCDSCPPACGWATEKFIETVCDPACM